MSPIDVNLIGVIYTIEGEITTSTPSQFAHNHESCERCSCRPILPQSRPYRSYHRHGIVVIHLPSEHRSSLVYSSPLFTICVRLLTNFGAQYGLESRCSCARTCHRNPNAQRRHLHQVCSSPLLSLNILPLLKPSRSVLWARYASSCLSVVHINSQISSQGFHSHASPPQRSRAQASQTRSFHDTRYRHVLHFYTPSSYSNLCLRYPNPSYVFFVHCHQSYVRSNSSWIPRASCTVNSLKPWMTKWCCVNFLHPVSGPFYPFRFSASLIACDAYRFQESSESETLKLDAYPFFNAIYGYVAQYLYS